MSNIIEEKGLVLSGHSCCPGCGGPILHRMIFNIIGKDVIQFGRGGCGTPGVGTYPMIYQFHSAAGAAGATGIVHALKAKGKKHITVVGLSGDGGASDTGFGAVASCASRNDNMFFFCYDNEAFMNTGIQQSRLTPYLAKTRTTPGGKMLEKKDMPFIMAHHYIPYVATLSIAYIADLTKKVEKGKGIQGFKYYQSLNPCPTGWGSSPSKTVEISRQAVQSCVWPLFEIEKGIFRLTMKPKKIHVDNYFKSQRRFSHLTVKQIQELQEAVDKRWERLLQIDGQSIWTR